MGFNMRTYKVAHYNGPLVTEHTVKEDSEAYLALLDAGLNPAMIDKVGYQFIKPRDAVDPEEVIEVMEIL